MKENECQWCGGPKTIREDERPCIFRIRKTCSRECRTALTNHTMAKKRAANKIVKRVDIKPRRCPECDKLFSIRKNERADSFKKLKRCPACTAERNSTKPYKLEEVLAVLKKRDRMMQIAVLSPKIGLMQYMK
jgi:hypothetical protein